MPSTVCTHLPGAHHPLPMQSHTTEERPPGTKNSYLAQREPDILSPVSQRRHCIFLQGLHMLHGKQQAIFLLCPCLFWLKRGNSEVENTEGPRDPPHGTLLQTTECLPTNGGSPCLRDTRFITEVSHPLLSAKDAIHKSTLGHTTGRVS